MRNPIESIIKNAKTNNPPAEGDYTGKDGLLYCGVCRKPKQCRITLAGSLQTVPTICDCIKQKQAEEKAQQEAERRNLRRERAFSDFSFREKTFDKDDHPESDHSRIARNYAASFDPANSKWLLFYGRKTGNGKSFLAACITNAVIDRGFTARFTSVSEIERELWDSSDKTAVFSALNRCDLLVFDDLKTERNTDYMQEIAFNLIDMRYRSRKPLIITSNITAEEFTHPKDLSKQRIFSRISEFAVPVLFSGEDRRREQLKATMQKELQKLLGE